jgi:hypothetical protein
MKRTFLSGLIALGLAAVAPQAYAASTLALDFSNTTGEGLVNGPFTVGWSFSVGRMSLSVTDLLVFDSGGDGLGEAHAVGIWDSLGNLLVSATVNAGTGNPLVVGVGAGWREVAVAPTMLAAGQVYTIGAVWLDGVDPMLFDVDTINGFTTNRIAFIDNRFIAGGSLANPTGAVSSNPAFFGPTFEANATPEPGSLMLIGGGLVALGLARKRRS